MRNTLDSALIALAVTLLAACASSPPPAAPSPSTSAVATQPPPAHQPRGELPARARYLPYVGAPIDHFNWMGHIDSWEPLSDSELVVFVGVNGAYLLTVWSPCGVPGLPWVHSVALTRSIGGSVYARLDSVRVEHMNCPISEIRPIDYQRLRQDARDRKAAPATPAANPPATP